MKIRPVVALIPALVLLAGCQQSADENADTAANETGAAVATDTASPVALATLSAADGAARGEAQVMTKADGLVVNVRAMGLAPGQYGLHVHGVGKCDAPDFTTAEGHWNPTGAQHGFDNPQGAHRGDLPNLTIADDGTGIVDFAISGATADGLLDADGAAIVIHAGPDDLKTDPSGDSGARIACGVLGAA